MRGEALLAAVQHACMGIWYLDLSRVHKRGPTRPHTRSLLYVGDLEMSVSASGVLVDLILLWSPDGAVGCGGRRRNPV